MNRTGRFRRPALATLSLLLIASLLAVVPASHASAQTMAVSRYEHSPGHQNTTADCTTPTAVSGSSLTSTATCDHNPSLTSRRWIFRVTSNAPITAVSPIFAANSPVSGSTVTKGNSIQSFNPLVSSYLTSITVNPDCTGDGDMTIRVTVGTTNSHLVISIDCEADITITATSLIFGEAYFSAHTGRTAVQNVGSVSLTLGGSVGSMSSCTATPTVASTSGGSGTLTTSVVGTGTSRRIDVTISRTGSSTGIRKWNVRVACSWQGNSASLTVKVNVTVTSLLDSIAFIGLVTSPADQEPGATYSDSFTTSALRTRPTCTASDSNAATTVGITNTRANDIQTNHTLTVSNTGNTPTTVTIRCTATNGGLSGGTITASRTVTIVWVDERAPFAVTIGSVQDGDLEGGNTATARATATVNRSTASCSLTRTGGTLNVTPSLGSSGTSRSILATVSATGTINFRVSCTHSGASASDTATFTFIDTGGVITPVLVTGLDNAPSDELTDRYTGTGFTTNPTNANCSIAKRSGVGTWRLINSDRTVQVDSTADGPTQGRLTCSATDRATTQITIRFSFADPDDDPIGGDTAVTIRDLEETPATRDVGTTHNDSFSAFTSPSSTVTCTAEKISGTGTFRLSSSRNLQVVGTANGDVVGVVSCSATGFETTEVVVTVPFRPTNTNQGRSVASGYSFLGGKGISSLTQIYLSGLEDGTAVTLNEGWLGGTPPPGLDGLDQHSWYPAFQYENSSFVQYTTSCSVARRSGPSTITYSLPRRAFGQIDTDPPNYYFWTTSTSGAYTTGYTRTARATRNGEAIFRVTCGSGASRSWFDVTVTAANIDAPADAITGFDGDAQRVIRGTATGSDQVTITPSTRACTARQVGGSLTGITPTIAPASGATRTVSVTATETGTVSVLLTCGTATATAIFTFHGEGESITGLNPASAHIAQGGGSVIASDPFTVSPGTLQCSAFRTGGTVTASPTITGNADTSGARTVSVSSSAEGTVTFTVSCGSVTVPDTTFTFTADDAPEVTITSFNSIALPLGEGGGTLTISSRYTFEPSTAACSVRGVGGTLRSSVTPQLRSVINPNTGEVHFFVVAASSRQGDLEIELTCGDDTETATFRWAAAGSTSVLVEGLSSHTSKLINGIGRITQRVVVTPAYAHCTATRTGGSLTTTPDIQPDPRGDWHTVTASVASQGTINFDIVCRVGSQSPLTASATWTFASETAQRHEIQGFTGGSGTVGTPVVAAFAVVPSTTCRATVTGGDAAGRQAVQKVIPFGPGYVAVVEVSATGAGSVAVSLVCGTDTETATFEFLASPDDPTPVLTWTGGTTTGTVGSTVRSLYSVTPLSTTCTVGSVTGTAAGRAADIVFDVTRQTAAILPLRYVEVTATGAGTAIVTLTCGTGAPVTRTFTFTAAAGTAENPALTWTGGTTTGTVGSTVRSLYSVTPLSVTCTVGAVTGTAAGRAADLVFDVTRQTAAILPLRYVEVTATGAGTAIVTLTCGTGAPVTRTFTFTAAAGTAENPALTWTGGTTTGTVGSTVRSLYSVTPLSTTCIVGSVTGTAAGGAADLVFDVTRQTAAILPLRYVEVTATGAGTVIVPLDCSGTNAQTADNTVTRTFTFAAPTGTAQNPALSWTGGSTTGRAGTTVRSLYSVTPLGVTCAVSVTASADPDDDASGGAADIVFDVVGQGLVSLTVRYVEVTATGAGNVNVLLDCSGTNAQTASNAVTRTFTFTAAAGTAQNPALSWTGGSTRGTVGSTVRSLYSVTPLGVTCALGAITGTAAGGAADIVFDVVGQGLVSLTVRYVEVTATGAGNVNVLLDCSGTNAQTASNAVTRTFTFTLPSTSNPVITGFDSQREQSRGGTHLLRASFTVTPSNVTCTLAGISWTDGSSTVNNPACNPDTGAATVAGTSWQIRYTPSITRLATYAEVNPTIGTLRLQLTCGTTTKTSSFTLDGAPQTVTTTGAATGRTGQELLIGYQTTPVGDAAACRVAGTTPDPLPDGYGTDLNGTVTPAVRIIGPSDTPLTVVAASSSVVGSLTATLTCGTGTDTYTATFTFRWTTASGSTTAISGFVAQSGATGRTLQAVFTTDPRELAITCTVAIATQDSGGNTVGLVDNLTDRNAISTATVTVTQPSAVTLPNGNYVWHSVSVTSDTAGVAEVRLSCGTDTADAAFTWAAVGTPESGTVSIPTLRATNTGVLDTVADDNILWLFDWFTPPDNSDCTAETNTDLYTLQLHRQAAAVTLLEGSSRNAVLLAFLRQDGFTDADLPSTRGTNERLLIAAFTRHVEAAITVTCGTASKTVRWGARRTSGETQAAQSVLITACADDAPDTEFCLTVHQRGNAAADRTATLTDRFTVSPVTATCSVRGGHIYATGAVTDTGGDAERTLTVQFTQPSAANFIVACSADNYRSAETEVVRRALPQSTTLSDPPPAPCTAGSTQNLDEGSLSLRRVPCVVALTVGVEKIVWYSVYPSDASCRWTKPDRVDLNADGDTNDPGEDVAAWSIRSNLTVAYSTHGSNRYLRFNASDPGYWQLRADCTTTTVDEFGITGTYTFQIENVQVRATAQGSTGIELPSFGGFGGGAHQYSWFDAVNRIGDCWDPSVAERERYEASYRAYTALLADLDIKFGYWHWASFQAELDELENRALADLPAPYDNTGGLAARRDVERYYREASEAQDRYLDMTDGQGTLSGWVSWIPFGIGRALSQTQIVSNMWEYLKRMPIGAACTVWRLVVPDSRDIVNVLSWGLSHRGEGCDGGDGPVEACDQGGLLTWPVEAANTASAVHTSTTCQGPDIGSFEITTGYQTDGTPITHTVGIGSAMAWALEIGAGGSSVDGGTVSVLELVTPAGSAGDGIVAVHIDSDSDGYLETGEGLDTDGDGDFDADDADAWGYALSASGNPTSSLFTSSFGGHWFSTCSDLHADDDRGGEGVWGRLWAIAAFSAILHALALLIMGLLLFRGVRLLFKEIGKNQSGGSDS